MHAAATGAGRTPRVDVGVVTWNTAELTVRALRTLLDHDQGCVVRLLVHDNASTDGTPEAIRRQVPEADLEVGPANEGFAAGVNRLLARSQASWFFALNSDAWPEPGAIGRLVEAAETRPSAAAVAPRLERPDGTLEHSTHAFPSLRLAAAAAMGPAVIGRRAAERFLLEGAWRHDRARDVDWAVGAALLLRRQAVEQIGGLDERYFMYVEDLEWCWRARAGGWTVHFLPEAVVRHVGNASGSAAYGDRRAATFLDNTYRFYRDAHGRLATAAFGALNLLGATRMVARATLLGDADTARFWRRQLPVHVRGVRGAS